MSHFTEAAITLLLFEEPSDAVQKPDPSSDQVGFMIGGITLSTKAELDQYIDIGHFQAVMAALEAAFFHMNAAVSTGMGTL